MSLEIGAAVGRSGRIVDRSAVGDDHQDAPLLRSRDQPIVRPEQSLAVDIFLQKTLAHHKAEVAPRMTIRFVAALVDDVSEVVEAARIQRAPCGEPRLAALPTLPAAGG